MIRGRIASKHIVQLFDTSDTLADGVSSFLLEALRAEDPVLVVARPANWRAIAERLEAHGCGIADAAARGRLQVRDAISTLRRFMRQGQPIAERFHNIVGDLVDDLSRQGRRRLCAYGEMVDVLAEEGNFASAKHVEELWNEIALRRSLTLLCGYSSAHFADPAMASTLAQICDCHSHLQTAEDDVMASWVLNRRTLDAVARAEASDDSGGMALSQ